MIFIDTNGNCLNEKKYIFDFLFKRINLDYQINLSEVTDITISNPSTGKKLVFDDIFFQFAGKNWLVDCLHLVSQESIDVDFLGLKLPGIGNNVPILFHGECSDKSYCEETKCKFDLFGSCFYLISRYEEVIIKNRDNHGRFSFQDSFVAKANCLSVPLVDAYTLILIGLLRHFIGVEVSEWSTHNYKVNVSCDIDIPFWAPNSVKSFVRRYLKDTLEQRSFRGGYQRFKKYIKIRENSFLDDPFAKNIEFIASENEKFNRKVDFFIIPLRTHTSFDNEENIESQRFLHILKSIKMRGHRIGVHPGYLTCSSSSNMKRSVEKFRQFHVRNFGDLREIISRQHYLRWDSYRTPELLMENGVTVDTTMGYADYIGFRPSTCSEFFLYDLKNRRSTTVLERPLNVMDATLLAPRYMGIIDLNEAIEKINELKEMCKAYNGHFNILWHNSYFEKKEYYEFYKMAIKE